MCRQLVKVISTETETETEIELEFEVEAAVTKNKPATTRQSI